MLDKDTDLVSEQATPIILDIKSDIFMAKNGKDTKQTRHISRRIYFVRNGEEWNFHKAVWCEGGMQLTEIGAKNVR